MTKNYLLTRLFFPQARIIRFPFDIRNRKLIKIGKNFTSGVGCRLETHPNDKKLNISRLFIGENVQINDYVHISAAEKIQIGNNVLIASKVFITDHNHGKYSGFGFHDSPKSIPFTRDLQCSQVIIEDNVWIGEFVSILPGVTIGYGSVIGTMTVVTKDIPPYSIAVGIPARIVKQYSFESKKWERIRE